MIEKTAKIHFPLTLPCKYFLNTFESMTVTYDNIL